jgi:hypothetical protein
MKKEKSRIPSSPTTGEILRYLQAEICKQIRWEWDKWFKITPFISIGFGYGCPRYPLEVSMKSLILDRYIAEILKDMGIPDAYITSQSYRNLEKDYLSVSGSSLTEFGRLNSDTILGWLSKPESRMPVEQELFSILNKNGLGEKYDQVISGILHDGGGA